MAQRIQLRRGTAAEWTAANPVLANGEPGVEKDTGKLKLGDGVTAWAALAYASAGPQGPAGVADDASVKGLIEDPTSETATALSVTIGEQVLPKLDKTEAATTYARPVGAFWTALGDSLTQGTPNGAAPGFPLGENYFSYALLLSGGALTAVRNAGAGGETSAQILARVDAEMAYKPNVVTILAGANDIITSVPLATTRANIAAIVNKVKAGGARPVLLTLPPTSNTVQKTGYAQLNAWIRSWAPRNGVTLVDITPALTDQVTGSWSAGFSTDNVHPTAPAMKIMGQLVADTLLRMFPNRGRPTPSYNTDPTNMVLNGLLLNDSGNDGIPDNFNVLTDSTYTVPGPLTTDTTFAAGKIATLTVTGTGFAQWNQGFGTGLIAAGDRIACGVALELVDTGSCDFYVFMAGASNGERIVQKLTTPAKGYVYAELIVPPGTTSILFRVRKTGAGTMKFGEPVFRNLTTLGLA